MLKPLVTQVWPQFTADEQFTASFSNVFVERVELFRLTVVSSTSIVEGGSHDVILKNNPNNV